MGKPWVVPFTAADVGTPDATYQQRVARAHALRAAGWKHQAIADELGVCWHSVHAYLTEPPPGDGGDAAR